MPRPPRPVTPQGIIAQRLARLVERAESGEIPGDLLDELSAVSELAAGFEPYVERCTSPESPALAALAARTAQRDWDARSGSGAVVALEQEMLSGHVEGRLLRFLVQMTGARRVLEIGMFTGYSALAIAEALAPGGAVVACELDPDVAAFAQAEFDRAAAGSLIDIRVGPAQETLADLAASEAPFDLVFIDADKAGYLGYLFTVLETGLLAPGGTVCVDNTLMQGQPWSGELPEPNGVAIAEFNAVVASDSRVEQVLVPLRDGITLIRRVA